MRLIEENSLVTLCADGHKCTISSKLINILKEEHPIRGKTHMAVEMSASDLQEFVEYLRDFTQVYPNVVERNALSIVMQLKKKISQEYERCKDVLDQRAYVWHITHASPLTQQKQPGFLDLLLGADQTPTSPYLLVGSKVLDDLHDQCQMWNKWFLRISASMSKTFELLGLSDIHSYFGNGKLFVSSDVANSSLLVRQNMAMRRSLAENARSDMKVCRQIQIRRAYRVWRSNMQSVWHEIHVIGARQSIQRIQLKLLFQKLKSN